MAIPLFFMFCVVWIVSAGDSMFKASGMESLYVILLFLHLFLPVTDEKPCEEIDLQVCFNALLANHTPKPSLNFSWLDDKNQFSAGDLAIIKIEMIGQFNASEIASIKHGFNPSVSVNGKTAKSIYISGLTVNISDDPSTWSVSFIPISVGDFNVLISDVTFGVYHSLLHYKVQPGPMHPAVSPVSWMDFVNEFVAGTSATVTVFPKDAFGNELNSTMSEPIQYYFHVFATYLNGSDARILSESSLGWDHHGIYLMVEFIVATAGDLLLHVEGKENQTFQGSSHSHVNRREKLVFRGSPLPFRVNPGILDISKCSAEWKFGANMLRLHSRAEVFIHQLDRFNNLVSELYQFDADIVEKDTQLSIPVADLRFKAVSYGVQLLTFDANETGDFFLMIYDAGHKITIANMPQDFTVFEGYCDESTSVINGSGLNTSIAGEETIFHVYLRDKYQVSSPTELGILEAQIVLENSSYSSTPRIHPIETITGSKVPWENNKDVAAPVPYFSHNNASSGTSKTFSSSYDVVYTPEKAGVYDIYVLCGNVLLNGGKPFKKDVKAGEANISLSFVRYWPIVKNKVQNYVIASLMDSYGNPVLSQQSKLKLEIVSTNHSGFLSWPFVDNRDGNYTGNYVAQENGTYEICVLFGEDHLLPCPININVQSGEYFPRANKDTVSVIEGESVAIDVLENDHFGGDGARITEYSYPHHGSLLYNGKIFRYTPHREYNGIDSFTYTISDANGCLASASVNITIPSIPPHFVSIPPYLEATEDVPSPKFGGGFRGLKIAHPDVKENITATLSVKSGKVSLSPMLMQFWEPLFLTVSGWEEGAKELTLIGNVEVINIALQSIQYFGKENFYGEDTIHCLASNSNGADDVNLTVSVEPVNDPPFIHVPEFITLGSNGNSSHLLYHKESELLIGDPDLPNFRGDKSKFVVMLSIEVDSGTVETSLPVEVVNTAELKVGKSHHWRPLETYVSMEKHFTVRRKGLRFQGTVDECNSVIQKLTYHDGDENEEGAVLTIRVNDLGNYGCYHADCVENMTRPLSTVATVNLIYSKPTGSFATHALAAAVILEFLLVLCLGVLLMSFTCKCIVSLMHDGSRRRTTTPTTTIFNEPTDVAVADLSLEPPNVATTGRFTVPFLSGHNQPFDSNSLAAEEVASCPQSSMSPPRCQSLEPAGTSFQSFSIDKTPS